jgi:predicted extracellular nuclease
MPLHTLAFYNLENLFDIYDDELTNDNDFLPDSVKKWTSKRYYNKLRKLGFSISNIGKEKTGKHPSIIGIAEVENKAVIEELLLSKHLKDLPYDYVHYDSPDERGIDVAFIYDTTIFELIVSEVFPVNIFEEDGTRDYTRDILAVTGKLDSYLTHFIVNHWPSRRDGAEETAYKRMIASEKVVGVIKEIKIEDPHARIIVMGDFNADPSSECVENLVSKGNLFNPMETINLYKRGSLSYDFKWNVFDQILLSYNFLNRNIEALNFVEADVFDADFLKLFKGPYKGTPFRTYVGKKYKGGYSDHFPAYVLIESK